MPHIAQFPIAPIAAVAASLALSLAGVGKAARNSGSDSNPNGVAPLDAGPPPFQMTDGSVLVDSSAPADSATPDDASQPDTGQPIMAVDAGVDAATLQSLVTGLGPGVVAHSAHFTLVTKTGSEPGGAGLKSSANFKLISGAAPPSAH